jgi:hypothetical protein
MNINKICKSGLGVKLWHNRGRYLHVLYRDRYLLKRNNFSFLKISFKNFCDQKNDQRYNLNYEPLQEQNVNSVSLLERILRLLIGAMLAIYFFKVFIFTKFNPISKHKEVYFINETCELYLNNFFSKKIQKIFENSIYKSDTVEVESVLKVFQKLLDKNKISFANKISTENIFVVDSPTIAAFLLKNGDLFISNHLFELCDGDENEIAFFISVEIANLLMGKVTDRFLKIAKEIYSEKYTPEFKKDKLYNKKIPKTDFVSYHRNKQAFINKYVLFYPESVLNTYFQEIDIMRNAIKVLNHADYDLNKTIAVMKKFDTKMMSYPKHYAETLSMNITKTKYRYFDQLNNMITVYFLN